MKKRNLLLVMLAVLLVFGMIVGCGKADDPLPIFPEPEPEPEPTGPDLDDETTYFGTYEATYTDANEKGPQTVTETIVFNDTYFLIYDTKPSLTGTPNTELSGDYLLFKISDWIKEGIETPAANKDAYPYAFKFTGTITAAIPKNTVASSGSNSLYGRQTAPGFTADDIKDAIPAYMYLYFDYKDGEITFIRTCFNRVTGGSADNDKVVNWATSGVNATKLRVFTFKDSNSEIDTDKYK